MAYRKRAIILTLLVLFLSAQGLFAQDSEKSDKGFTKLRIEVTAGEADKPVENASVYIRYTQERGLAKDRKVEMNFKTNREGLVRAPNVPRGKVLIQVIAQGWKTFGQWYDIDQDEQTIKIRLQKPPRWY